ncbi:hypothetical protein Sango_2996200 [Sesamum angolense]|uniref:Uncharacterized protein n=1 Tax=Sesamum angolense TaxID=2727404 RepID=A0AAE1T306_9LAMI|nr:hypothetical protein Sango_2996200 [Sesamum angolense]
MRKFLWYGPTGSGNAKVAWERICKPKEEGGLGLHSLITTNQALMLKQLWRIIQNDGTSLWVDWIQLYRLRNSTIWIVNGALGSWGWRKMLNLRPLLQRGVIYKVGDVSSFSLWQDIWHKRGPLCLIYPRGPTVTFFASVQRDTEESVVLAELEMLQLQTSCHTASFNTRYSSIHHSWRSSSGKYSFQAAVSLIQPTTPHVFWHGLLKVSLRFRGVDLFFGWPYWKNYLPWINRGYRVLKMGVYFVEDCLMKHMITCFLSAGTLSVV